MVSEEILSKLKKLVALTDSPEKEEARTAAYMAVSMIKKYNVMSLLEKSSYKAPFNPPPPPQPSSYKKSPQPQAKHKQKPNEISLRDLAALRVDKAIDFLKKEAAKGRFPLVSVMDIVENALDEKDIEPFEARSFQNCVSYEFQLRKQNGIVEGKRGRHGGYFMKCA